MKFVVTEIEGTIDWTIRLKIKIHQFFFSFICYNCPTKNHKSILWNYKITYHMCFYSGQFLKKFGIEM